MDWRDGFWVGVNYSDAFFNMQVPPRAVIIIVSRQLQSPGLIWWKEKEQSKSLIAGNGRLFLKQPSYGIPLHIFYISLHILYSALFGVCRTPGRRLRKCRHITGIFLLLCCCQGSLIVRRHNTRLRIPYPIECILPSSSHLPPGYRMRRNDYKLQRILNMHLYNFGKYDNLS